ncbi:MAG: OmpA family protein [Actinomycetota bacterium]
MTTIFDEAVSLLGHNESVESLARELGEVDTKPVQVGVVLSLPVVVAGLDSWLADQANDERLEQMLHELRPVVPVTGYPTLAEHYDVPNLGHELLSRMFGPGVDDVTARLADRAELSMRSAAHLLAVAAATVQVRLADRNRSTADRAPAADVARADAQVHDAGWAPWIARTVGAVGVVGSSQAGGGADDDGRLHPAATGSMGAATAVGGLQAASAAGGADGGRGADRLDGGPGPIEPVWPTPQDRGRGPVFLLAGAGAALLLAVALALALNRWGDGTELAGTEATTTTAAPTATSEETGGTAADDAAPPEEGDEQGTAADEQETTVDAAPLPAAQTLLVELVDPLARSGASGIAAIEFDAAAERICFDFETEGMSERYDGHIHVGPAGVKGGIIVDYGELTGATEDCLAVSPVDIAAILEDPAGHYVEFHEETEAFTIRAQLGEAAPGAIATEEEADGAYIVIGPESLILRGEVPDEVAAEKLAETFSDVELDGVDIVDELEIVPGAPRPSGRIVVDEAILFAVDSDQLTDADSSVLSNLALLFTSRPAWTMVIVGHTDDIGPEVYNLELSLRRAEAVRGALTELGVPADVMSIEGAGATDPIASNDSAGGRSQNRRIEFDITGG